MHVRALPCGSPLGRWLRLLAGDPKPRDLRIERWRRLLYPLGTPTY